MKTAGLAARLRALGPRAAPLLGRFAGCFTGRLADLLAPPACLVCDRRVERQGGLCPACWRSLRFIETPYCEALGTPFAQSRPPGTLSLEALADPPPFARLRAAVLYDEPARTLAARLKFADRTDLAPWMAAMMARAGRELLEARPVVLPVPLHWRRLLHRRYNQAAELARPIARGAGLPFEPQALIRWRATDRQTELSATARADNVAGAFRVPLEARPVIAGRRILLVDDVATTTATVRACARALRRAGAGPVDVLVFARVEAGPI